MAVSEDIMKTKERFHKARVKSANRGLSIQSSSGRLSPDVWPEPQDHFACISVTRSKSPGPKYNLQPWITDGKTHNQSRQNFTHTIKDITFKKAPRMPDGMTIRRNIFRTSFFVCCRSDSCSKCTALQHPRWLFISGSPEKIFYCWIFRKKLPQFHILRPIQ